MFFRLLPLHTGVELIFIFTAINKMSGVYGLLSLFTNHPINFIQWMYYLLNTLFVILTMICYTYLKKTASFSLSNTSLNTDENMITIKFIAAFIVFYFIDFFTGNLFMVYLANLWLTEEYLETDSSSLSSSSSSSSTSSSSSSIKKTISHMLNKRVSDVLSEQSASEGYEIFVCVVTILISECFRLYFMAIVLSYYLRLRKRISRTCFGFGTRFVDLLDKLK
ncbi:Kei1 protein [Pichia kluyveri]|uniref:Kei1 protein n=1 Tax=Pichia kluyveri TaxID=36015 RepID=A0AAV5R907_PICKL|nr:hypothetical protein DAPK24_040650 [Pichia kluyveri]GMM47487.1 Kei1 protein [Pichia kluyveri]